MRQRRMFARCLPAVAGLMLCLPLTQVAAAIDIIVNPADGANGLVQALQSARNARQKNKGTPQPIRIVLKAGTYVLTAPWVIGSADSGTSDAPLLIEPEVPGTVTLVGGAPMPMASKSGKQWTFTPPQDIDREAERAGGQLYVNGKRAVLAREPNEGSWMYVQAPSKDQLMMTPTDAGKVRQLLDEQRDRAIIELMQSWTSGMHRAGTPTPDGNGLTLQPAPKWPMLMFGSAQRFYIENVPGALDAPGEWLALDGRLHYIPRKDDGATGTAVWPRLPTLLSIHGDDNGNHTVRHVQLKGLKFAYTGVTTPMSGWLDTQAAVDIAAAIEVDNADDVQLTQCDVRHTGGYGVWLKGGVINSEVSGCVMDDLGAGGIKLGMTQTQAATKTGHNTIVHNVLMHTGRTFPGAVALWVGKSGNNVLTDNVIGHTSYTGISVGWTWGYGDQDADGNQIKRNVLFDIGQGMLSDMGAIYTLGKGKGTEISGNLIRQVQDYPFYGAGAWGIYSDEGSSDMNISGNVVVGTRSGGYHLHWGQDNIVRDNLFANGGQGEVRWSDPAHSGMWQLLDNATDGRRNSPDLSVDGDQRALLPRMGLQVTDNQLPHVSVNGGATVSDVKISGGQPRQQAIWLSTLDKARSTLDASVKQLGVDLNLLTLPTLTTPLEAPLLSWKWRFDQMAVGAPVNIRFEPVRSPPVVRIAQDTGPAANGTCLLLADGDPSLLRYEPYVFVKPDLPVANTTADFEVKLDVDSLLIHEWRNSNGKTFKSLIKFSMSVQHGLQIDNKEFMALQPHEWLHVKVETRTNESRQTSWSLSVTGSDGNQHHWADLPLLSNDVPRIGWMGWISDTAQAAQTCLKRIDIHPGTRP